MIHEVFSTKPAPKLSPTDGWGRFIVTCTCGHTTPEGAERNAWKAWWDHNNAELREANDQPAT